MAKLYKERREYVGKDGKLRACWSFYVRNLNGYKVPVKVAYKDEKHYGYRDLCEVAEIENTEGK